MNTRVVSNQFELRCNIQVQVVLTSAFEKRIVILEGNVVMEVK